MERPRDFEDLNDMEKEIEMTGHVKEIEKFEELLLISPKQFCDKYMHGLRPPLRTVIPRKAWKAIMITVGLLLTSGFVWYGYWLGGIVVGFIILAFAWMPIIIIWSGITETIEPLPIYTLNSQSSYPMSDVPTNEAAACSFCGGRGQYEEKKEVPERTYSYVDQYGGWSTATVHAHTSTVKYICGNCGGFGTFWHFRSWIVELNKRLNQFNSRISEINIRVDQVNALLEHKNEKIKLWNRS